MHEGWERGKMPPPPRCRAAEMRMFAPRETKRSTHMDLYLFNPDSDLALGNNSEYYRPPANACRLTHDLALLPAWYAEPGSTVLVPREADARHLDRLSHLLPQGLQAVTYLHAAHCQADGVQPWGWNKAVRRRLADMGIRPTLMPDDARLDTYRRLSARPVAAEWLRKLQDDPACTGECAVLHTPAQCQAYAEARRAVVFKAPWSGSGKGLRWCKGDYLPSIAGWCARVLQAQGCIVASPVYDKAEDFALEFHIGSDCVPRFAGYSLFTTNERGGYTGNWLLPDDDIEARLARYVGPDSLRRVRHRVALCLEHYARHGYRGWLGVDMMVCRDAASSAYKLYPFVEVNLRMNMGLVASRLRQMLAPGVAGRFFIDYCPTTAQLADRCRQDDLYQPPQWLDGHLLTGRLTLTRVAPDSHYRACVEATLTADRKPPETAAAGTPVPPT